MPILTFDFIFDEGMDMRTFYNGRTLGLADLSIMVRDENSQPVVPESIKYEIYSNIGGVPTLVMGPKLDPATSNEAGYYFISTTIPTAWAAGPYKLVWYLKQNAASNETSVYEDFFVASPDPARSGYEAPSVLMASRLQVTQSAADTIMMVRELLSDTNPDRNYHFRPPTAAKTIAGYSQKVGFIWTDETILRMLNIAFAKINTYNEKVLNSFSIDNADQNVRAAAAVGAAALCLSAEAARWTADEFGYSLNGVNIDLNKHDSYMSLAESYKTEFTEWLPMLTANRPVAIGLRQSRWLI